MACKIYDRIAALLLHGMKLPLEILRVVRIIRPRQKTSFIKG